jgi:hypothetical protein
MALRDLEDFELSLKDLKDHPDDQLMRGLVSFAQQHITKAGDVVKRVKAHLDHPDIPPTFIVPMWYVVDAISKNVPRGAYHSLFAMDLQRTFKKCYDSVPAAEKDKMVRMISTWEEQKLYDLELVHDMKAYAMGGNDTSASGSRKRGGTNGIGVGAGVGGSAAKKRVYLRELTSEEFQSLLFTEMQRLLAEISSGLGEEEQMTLQDLYQLNPTLYSQLYQSAEGTVRSRPLPGAEFVSAFVDEVPCRVNVSVAQSSTRRLLAVRNDQAWVAGGGGGGGDVIDEAAAVEAAAALEVALHMQPLLARLGLSSGQRPSLPPILVETKGLGGVAIQMVVRDRIVLLLVVVVDRDPGWKYPR